MKRIVYLTFTLAVALFVATDAQAQKWPERSRVRRGNRAYERLDYDRAEERYREAQQLSDTCFEAQFNLGDALYKQQRFDEAEKVFAALAADSTRSSLDRAHSYYNLGNSQFIQQKLQEALKSYRQSLVLRPDDMEAKYNYAYTKKLIQEQENQENQQNQQNQNDQNQQNQEQQNQDQQQEGQQQEQQGGDDKQQPSEQQPQQDGGSEPQQGDEQGEPQQIPSGISPQEQQAMLDAIQHQEDKTQEKLGEGKKAVIIPGKKNW